MPQPESAQEQIKWLQEQLEAKQQELTRAGEQKHERDVLKEVVRDISAEKIFPGDPSLTVPLSNDDTTQKAQELRKRTRAYYQGAGGDGADERHFFCYCGCQKTQK